MAGYQTVVVGTDGSDTSFRAVERAAELARDEGATLVIACAFIPHKPDPATQDILRDEAYQVVGSAPADDTVGRARDRAAGAGATKIDTVAVEGRPAEVLIRVAAERGADLLVVGSVGLNTLRGRIIGSVPLDVARHAPTDVLIVRTTG